MNEWVNDLNWATVTAHDPELRREDTEGDKAGNHRAGATTESTELCPSAQEAQDVP